MHGCGRASCSKLLFPSSGFKFNLKSSGVGIVTIETTRMLKCFLFEPASASKIGSWYFIMSCWISGKENVSNAFFPDSTPNNGRIIVLKYMEKIQLQLCRQIYIIINSFLPTCKNTLAEFEQQYQSHEKTVLSSTPQYMSFEVYEVQHFVPN